MSRLLRLSILASVVLALAVLASPALAQPPGGPGGGGRFGGRFGGGMMGGMMGGGMMGGGLGLLRNEQVQGELKLTEEQKTKLQDLADKLRDQFRERMANMGNFRDMSEEEREKLRKEGEKAAADIQKKLAEILTADQAKRLKQIEWQQLGPAALVQPEVAEAVGLSSEQKEQLATINREAGEKRMQLIQGARGGEQGDRRQQFQDMRQRFEEMREKGEQITQELNQKSMAVLQPEQKGKLKELMGAPFELDRSQMFGGPGRGPGAQGGERGDRGGDRGSDRPRRSQQRQE